MRFRKKTLLAGTIILFLALLPVAALASVLRNEGNLQQNEVISSNFYIAGSAPVIAGTVQGDMVAAGGTVVLTGQIVQDALIAGGNINVTGPVGGDLRVFGGSIYLDGVVQGEVFTAGGDVRIGPNAVVRGDLIANGGNVKIDPAAKIYGNKKIESGDKEIFVWTQGFQTAFLIGQLLSIIGLLLVGAIYFRLLPQMTNRIINNSLEKGGVWKNLGLGFLMFLIMPVGSLVCFITGFGTFLGMIVLFSFILYILASIVFAGAVFGGWLYKVTKKPKKLQMTWGALIAGIILLHIISLVPFIGWIITMVVMMITWGALARFQWALLKNVK